MELSNLQERLHEPGTAEAAAPADSSRSCGHCGKHLPLAASAMPCRCSRAFCDAHRAPEDHACPEAESIDLAALHRERQARDLASAPRMGAAVALPRMTVHAPDYRACFEEAHDMESRVAHAVAFVLLGLALVIGFFHLFGFSWAALLSALLWSVGGVVCATVVAKYGPRLSTAGHPVCSSCMFSWRSWWLGGPSFRTMREVEYESAMEVLIYYCSYRKTNCLTGTLYGGPREFGFIARTVLAKVTSLSGSGNGQSIFTGCQGPTSNR
mmetsp:Transcript_116750/g.341810  ORF Transcript_116750/g.341810 Transcript_116750/m.341810 type:complete len:268 (-) Transcript_116750:90-893(-)